MKKRILWTTACIMLMVGGCSKDAVKRPICAIIAITGPGGHTESFYYDDDGRLQSVTEGSSVSKFSYVGDSIIKESTWKSVYALNKAGMLAFERREYSQMATKWETRTYDYDGVELKKVTVKSYSGNNVRSFSWRNGNLMAEHIQGATYSQQITYEYYSDKAYQPGDIQSWDLLENGVETIRNKNLTRKYTSVYTDSYGTEKEVLNYSYRFDSDGKMMSMTVTGEGAGSGSPSIYTFTYTCH